MAVISDPACYSMIHSRMQTCLITEKEACRKSRTNHLSRRYEWHSDQHSVNVVTYHLMRPTGQRGLALQRRPSDI